MAASCETEVREFASQFPTPNVKLMVQLCEAGSLSWEAAYGIARESLAEGLEAVS